MDEKTSVQSENKLIKEILTAICLFFMALLFCMSCVPNLFSVAEPNCDANVFRTVAYVMRQGGLPYRDSFDHKGPIIYFLNVLGQMISFYRGIWVIEVANLFATYYVIYRIGRLFCSRFLAILLPAIVSVPMFEYMEGGDFVEEFAMPCIAIAVFIFTDYFKNEKISWGRLLVLGASFSYVMLLRPNMVGIWAIGCLAVFVHSIMNKSTNRLFYYLGLFIAGAILLVAPILVWIYINGIWDDFVYNFITFNSMYSFGDGFWWSDRIHSFLHYMFSPFVVISILLSAYCAIKKDRIPHVVMILSLLLSVVFISIGGRVYGHYGFVLVPLYSMPFAATLGDIEREHKQDALAVLVGVLLMVIYVLPDWCNLAMSLPDMYIHGGDINEVRSETLNLVCSIVEDNTDETDRISVYGNWDSIYLITGRLPSSKYSYQLPIGRIDPNIMDEYQQSLIDNPPKLLVIEKRRYAEEMKEFLDSHEEEYELMWASNPDDLSEAAVIFKHVE